MEVAIKKLIVHHSASPRATTTKLDIDKWHRQRGFSQIGYHKVVEGSGNIVSGRPENVQGAHAKGANHDSLGVCVVGNFENESPTAAQINSLVKVLVEWCKKYNLKPTDVYGHTNTPGNVTKTSCPGKNLYAQLPLIKQKVQLGLNTP